MTEPRTINPTDAAAKQSALDELLLLIQQESAVVKMFRSEYYPHSQEPMAWSFLINQLADPNHNRPVPRYSPRTSERRENYWNPRTGVRTNPRPLNPQRGQPKKPGDQGYGFTKKTAVSLVPRNGKIHLFKAEDEGFLGLMFNLNHCYLKDEKYIWTTNAMSDLRLWLGPRQSDRSVGLQGLKNHLRRSEKRSVGPMHNEMLIGLSDQALSAIVVTRMDSLITRLNALRFQSYVQQKLHKKLPIVRITEGDFPIIYEAQQQLADIKQVLENNQLSIRRRSYIPDIFRNMDLQKMQGDIMEEIQQASAEYRIDLLMKSCLGADENQLLQRLQQDNLIGYLNDDQKKQLLQLTITHNFTKLAPKLLDVGATLGKSASGSPNVLLESFQKGHLAMLDILLARFPQIFENHKVILADAIVDCLRDGDFLKVWKMINAAQQTGYSLSDLQQASTGQVNFLTLVLQQPPIDRSLIQVLAGGGIDFNFPLSSDALSRPLEFAFSMISPDLVIDIINLTLDHVIQQQLFYLKQIGMQLPVKNIEIDNPKIRAILPDEKWTPSARQRSLTI